VIGTIKKEFDARLSVVSRSCEKRDLRRGGKVGQEEFTLLSQYCVQSVRIVSNIHLCR
jgi:hypothetical protein